ncbi:MAG: hypothetical protein ACKOGH_18470 [Alphaproteobacteria bacterium]
MGSFWKLLVVVAVVAIAWFGWRWFQRWEKERREIADRRGAEDSVRRQRAKPGDVQVEDLAKCRTCGAFVAAGARGCGQPRCPYPG